MEANRKSEQVSETAAAAGTLRSPGVAAVCADLLLPLRMLVVEDDALIGFLLAEMLYVMGHEVCAVEATESGAVSAAARHLPDMMIVDAQLRSGNGFSAVDQILKANFVPHVFVSGDIRDVFNRKPSAIAVSKPFTEAMLTSAIARARGRGR